MIVDQKALDEAKENWAGVEALRAKLQRSAFASLGAVGGLFPFALADAAHNLPMFHAFGVLNDVLQRLALERDFGYKGRELGRLVQSSERAALPWKNLDAIRKGIKARNGVAHKGALVPRGECWNHIEAVKSELDAWGVI